MNTQTVVFNYNFNKQSLKLATLVSSTIFLLGIQGNNTGLLSLPVLSLLSHKAEFTEGTNDGVQRPFHAAQPQSTLCHDLLYPAWYQHSDIQAASRPSLP